MRGPGLDCMHPDVFLAWQIGRDGLYELVDGVVTQHEKMRDGVSRRHDHVKVNLIGSLGVQLRRTPYSVVTGCVALRTGPSTFRRPDLMVACGPIILDAYEVSCPRLAVEVLSPSTNGIERFRKIDEYKQHPTLTSILLVETRRPEVLLYQRAEGNWINEPFVGLQAAVAFPTINARLTLTDIYEGLTFDPRTESSIGAG